KVVDSVNGELDAYTVIANPHVIGKFQAGNALISPAIKNQLENTNITTYSELVSLAIKTSPSSYTGLSLEKISALNKLLDLAGGERYSKS
ncbi:AAA family ATPase, partial [Mycoplasma flocculare]